MTKERKLIQGATFMAVATGTVAKEAEIKRYRGVGAVGVVALNPTREESNKIFNSTQNTEEIKYLGEGTVKDAKGQDVKVPQIRLNFILKTDPAIACNSGIETLIPVSIFLNKAYSYSNKDNVLKVQVIDKYGRTAWVTQEQMKNGEIPEYTIKNGERAGQTMKAALSAGYRPCYVGEEDLVKFIIALLNIPRPDVWDAEKKQFFMKTDPKELAESECMLDNIKDYFTGNISELKKILTFQPNNRFKLCFGVRTASNGTQYQCAYTRMPMKLAVTSLKQLEKALQEDKAAGRHPSEEYFVGNLEEVKLGATDYTKPQDQPRDADPFAAAAPAGGAPASGSALAPGEDMPPDDADPFGAM